MQNIKRFVSICLVLLLLVAFPVVLSADEKQPDNVKVLTISKDGSSYQLGRNNDVATFWEFPVLTAGQSRSDGTLTIKSEIDGDAVIDMTSIGLPYGDEAAFEYLNALHLSVTDAEGKIIYDGSYAHIADLNKEGKLDTIHITLKGGESVTYNIALSCDFGFTGKNSTNGKIIVYSYTVDVGIPGWINYAAYIAIAIAIAVIVTVLLVVLRHRRTSFGVGFDDD